MTYREKIQAIVATLDGMYDDAGWLRDKATLEEQEHWNRLRKLTSEAMQNLNKLDNSLSDGRAARKV